MINYRLYSLNIIQIWILLRRIYKYITVDDIDIDTRWIVAHFVSHRNIIIIFGLLKLSIDMRFRGDYVLGIKTVNSNVSV